MLEKCWDLTGEGCSADFFASGHSQRVTYCYLIWVHMARQTFMLQRGLVWMTKRSNQPILGNIR